jgi:hypothetical protein
MRISTIQVLKALLLGDYHLILDGHHRIARAAVRKEAIEMRAIDANEFGRILRDHFDCTIPHCPFEIIPFIQSEL